MELEHTQIAQGFFQAAEDDKEEAQIKLTHKLSNDIRLLLTRFGICPLGKQNETNLSSQQNGAGAFRTV